MPTFPPPNVDGNLVWKSLIPQEDMANSQGLSDFKQGLSAFSDVWDVIDPLLKAIIQLVRIGVNVAAMLAFPDPMIAVRTALHEAIAMLEGFINSGVAFTVYHNVKRNPRYIPREQTSTGQLDEVIHQNTDGGGRNQISFGPLAHRPKRGCFCIEVPGSTTRVTAQEDGTLTGSCGPGSGGNVTGRIDLRTRRGVLYAAPGEEFSVQGDFIATYTDAGVAATALPFTGTGASGWVSDVVDSFPAAASGQSLTGLFLIAGSDFPDDITDIAKAIGRLTGAKEFIRLGAVFENFGERVEADAAAVRNGFASLDWNAVRKPPKVGWGWNGPYTLPDAIPALGGLFKELHKAIDKLVPPSGLSEVQDAVIEAIEAKLNEISRIITFVSARIEDVIAILSMIGSNFYVLPMVEQAEMPNGTTSVAPLGLLSGGGVYGGTGSTSGKFGKAMLNAVWEVGVVMSSATGSITVMSIPASSFDISVGSALVTIPHDATWSTEAEVAASIRQQMSNSVPISALVTALTGEATEAEPDGNPNTVTLTASSPGLSANNFGLSCTAPISEITLSGTTMAGGGVETTDGEAEPVYSDIPPASIGGNAIVIGVGLVAMTGQAPTSVPGGLCFGGSQPTPMSVLSGIFGVDLEQVAGDFGAATQNIQELASSLSSTPAP